MRAIWPEFSSCQALDQTEAWQELVRRVDG